jgi:hypothetical protein
MAVLVAAAEVVGLRPLTGQPNYIDLMVTSVSTGLDAIVTAIGDRLAQRSVLVPQYAIRDAVTEIWRRQNPGAAVDDAALDARSADELISSFVRQVTDPAPRTGTTPAALTYEAAGQLIAALAVTVHCTSMNLDRDRLEIAETLGAASVALAAVGTALRDTSEDRAVVLIDSAALDRAATAVSATLTGIEKQDWQVPAATRPGTLALLTHISAQLDAMTEFPAGP